jgi:glucose/arabinose dehydrogenase
MGCRIRFGPDGYLWVGTGDTTQGPVPQSRTSLGGKILRITTDGAGAPGNAGDGFRPEVYTYGHRNPQGIAFSPSGQAYDVEHGPDRDDEVNRLVRGGNYGWDPVAPGGTDYDQSRPMTDLGKFPNAQRAVWSSGVPTIAPSGATFLTGAQWSGWDGALAIAVLKGQQLRVLALSADGTAVEQQWARITDRGRLRSAVQGPDGALYLATDANPGAILRVTPPPAGG